MGKGKYNHKRQRKQQRAEQDGTEPSLAVKKSVEAKKEGQSTKHGNSDRAKTEEDLMSLSEFFKGSSVTDWFIAIFTFVLAVAAIYQFNVTNGQLGKMQQQLDQSDRQFSVAHRPWVEMKGLKTVSPLIFDLQGAHADVSFTVQNGGSSPASKTMLGSGELLVQDARGATFINNLVSNPRFACTPNRFLGSIPIGMFLLPGDSEPYPAGTLSIKRSDIPIADRVFVYWIDCIAYSDDSGNTHGTSFIYEFRASNGDFSFAPTGAITGEFTNMGLNKAY